MKYFIRKCKYKISLSFSITCLHAVLALHAYMPEQTVTLTKYYRNIVSMVKGIIKSYMCIKQLNKL